MGSGSFTCKIEKLERYVLEVEDITSEQTWTITLEFLSEYA
jgi:hypothetical protein